MDNARNGKRKAKATSLPVQGTTLKKLREDEPGGRAAYKASEAAGGAEAARVVAAGGAGVGVAAVEAVHRALGGSIDNWEQGRLLPAPAPALWQQEVLR